MYQLFIIDSNHENVENLLNQICSKYENARIGGIASTKENAIQMLNTHYQTDIVLITENFEEGGTYLDVLNSMTDKARYKKTWLIMCNSNVTSIPAHDCIYSAVSKANGTEGIMRVVNRMMDHVIRNKIIITNAKEKIQNEMTYLGFDVAHKGTKYIAKAIEYMIENSHKNIDKLEKSIYPVVSECYDNTVHNIKCDVIRAISMMYYNCEIEKLQDYFCIDADSKPNVKTVLNTIANKVSKEY